MFGEKLFSGVGYPTPLSIPDLFACRQVKVPANVEWEALLMGLMATLTDETSWQQLEGGISREDAASVWLEMVDSMYTSAESEANACAGDNTSPFWDDPDGADADGSPADNTYTWGERLEDWTIAAFVAASGVPGAAATYLTVAPRFRLLFKTGDWGGIVNVFIDDELFTVVDTFRETAGLLPVDIVIPA